MILRQRSDLSVGLSTLFSASWCPTIYMRRVSFVAIALLAPILLPPGLQSKLPQDENTLVTVSVHPDRIQLRPGDDLGVEVTIAAGPHGVYLPNFFGDFLQTCRTGFSVDIFTLQGKRASDETRGCAGSELTGAEPPARELLGQYVFLKPGEIRSWRTTLTKITRSPGTYEVKAEYLSNEHRIKEVAALPEVHGLMVVGTAYSKPVWVRIQ